MRVAAPGGRAVSVTSGESGGLTTTLPGALTQLQCHRYQPGPVSTQNKIPALAKKINRADDELKAIPAELPANQINPDAKIALGRAHRGAL
jgi:hypothetical protein